MFIRNIAKHSSLLVSLCGAILLSLESFLALYGKSVCNTKACDLVSNYIAIPESLLISGGALGFWCVSLLIFFSLRYQDKAKFVPILPLALALALDSSLIGFQFFTIQQYCLICIIVALLLVLATVLYCLQVRYYAILSCLLIVWIGAFGIQKIMVMPMPASAYDSMSFYKSKPPETSQEKAKQKITLIFSMNCPHCLEVIKFLSEKELYKKYAVSLVCVDKDRKSLDQLQNFLEEVPSVPNPFQHLSEIKEKSKQFNGKVNKKLQISSQNGLVFLSNLGIRSVPVMLIEPSENEKNILISSDQILKYLKRAEH